MIELKGVSKKYGITKEMCIRDRAYYMVALDSGTVSGPYTETELAAACAEQGVDAADIGWQEQKDWNKVYDR